MVRVRSKALVNIPPPAYHPDSSCLTLVIYHGGTIENNMYTGGDLRKIDYVDIEKLNFLTLDEYVQDLIVDGRKKVFYTAVNGSFKLLNTVKELKIYGKKYIKKKREYPLVLQDGGPLVQHAEKVNAVRVNEVPARVGAEVEGPLQVTGVSAENKNAKNTQEEVERETSEEFFMRVDDTQEWIDEYCRRYPGKSSTNHGKAEHVNEHMIDNETGNNHEDVIVNDTVDPGDEETGYVESERSSNEDDSFFDNIIEQAMEPPHIVDDSTSSDDDEYALPPEDDTIDDDQLFDDCVSSSAEMGDGQSESSVESVAELVDYAEDVVGSDDDHLDLNRVSDDEGVANSLKPFNEDNVYDPEFDLGQTFLTKALFKQSVVSYAVKIRRTLPFRRSDSRRVYVRCSESGSGCPFKINAVKVVNTTPENKHAFVIRELCLEHTCAEGWFVKNLKIEWLAQRYVAWFKTDPKRCVKGFRADVQKKLNVNVSKDQAYRAKQAALKLIQGDPDLQYTKLWDYASELRRSNPGSTVIVGTEEKDGEQRFSKFYVCFKAMKDGFKHCRPIIGVDGCHLKGPHAGILLTAVGVDPDNGNYPICYCVVSTENKENWAWFLTVLKADLDLGNGKDFTFISDKQKGLISALPEIFPAAEVRFCVRHLVVNMHSAGHKGTTLTNMVWKAAKSTTVAQFTDVMKTFKDKFPEAADWLKDKHPREWSKSHFMERCKCEQILNNSCESFNSCILDARVKPILTMLEWIREYVMKLWHLCRETAETWEGLVCPTIAKIVETHGKKVGGCRPIKASRVHFQVSCVDGGQHAVDLGARTCSCRKWQLSGIPCKHSLSAMNNERFDGLDFVDAYYHVSTYKAAYSGIIVPISGQNVWDKTMFIPPLPPKFGRKAGRPSRLRRRGVDEKENKGKAKKRGPVIRKLRRFQTTIRCGHCGQPGHNALFCEQLPQSAKDKVERLKRRAFEEVGESSNAAEGHVEHDAAMHECPVEHMLPPQVATHQEAVAEEQPVGDDRPDYTFTADETISGPTMYEQLQMGNPEMHSTNERISLTVQEIANIGRKYVAKRKHKTLGLRRVQMRVPPTLTDEDVHLSQQSTTGPMVDKTIVLQGGKKYLSLSGNGKKA